MKNIDLKLTDDKKTLTITIDLTQRIGRSKSGKNVNVASTFGNVNVPGTSMFLGLNLYVKE